MLMVLKKYISYSLLAKNCTVTVLKWRKLVSDIRYVSITTVLLDIYVNLQIYGKQYISNSNNSI